MGYHSRITPVSFTAGTDRPNIVTTSTTSTELHTRNKHSAPDSSLEIELAIPFVPKYDHNYKQQAQLGDFTHYHLQFEFITDSSDVWGGGCIDQGSDPKIALQSEFLLGSHADSDEDIRVIESDLEEFKESADVIDNIRVNPDTYVARHGTE
ncbi:hypothetical protein TNCV_3708701 [Trichonephila clavipes]|nr:hypothetical protein TNCV_3708701 [Trichonephila clavipes]